MRVYIWNWAVFTSLISVLSSLFHYLMFEEKHTWDYSLHTISYKWFYVMEYHHRTLQNYLNKNLKITGSQYHSTKCFMNWSIIYYWLLIFLKFLTLFHNFCTLFSLLSYKPFETSEKAAYSNVKYFKLFVCIIHYFIH